MRTEAFGCGCFIKLYVCPQHVLEGAKDIEVRLGQLALDLQYEEREEDVRQVRR